MERWTKHMRGCLICIIASSCVLLDSRGNQKNLEAHMRSGITAALTFAATIFIAAPAQAHCDGLDGPVVAAAKGALASGNPAAALIWVQPADESELRASFNQAVSVRKLGDQARELADRHFFETSVRLHRAGEGAPYTGLKPAGRDPGAAILLADEAVSTGSESKLVATIGREVEAGIRERFADLQRKRDFRPDDLAAGRAYVASYVTFVHYAEGLHEAAKASAAGHYQEGHPTQAEHHE
jgi:hypothetical protein